MANNTDEAPFEMGSKDVARASIPSGMISLSDFNSILPAVRAGQLTVAGPIPAAELHAYYMQVRVKIGNIDTRGVLIALRRVSSKGIVLMHRA